MIDATIYQTVSVVLASLSVSLAAFYYMMTLRNTKRQQEVTLETRQAQLFMQLYQDLLTEDNMRSYLELLNMEWEDYDDFERKYGSDYNPDSFAKRNSFWFRLNGIGSLLKDGLIDPEKVFNLLGTWTIWQWKKWESIIIELRARYNQPEILTDFEHLANEMLRIRLDRGITVELPKTFTRYVPTAE